MKYSVLTRNLRVSSGPIIKFLCVLVVLSVTLNLLYSKVTETSLPTLQTSLHLKSYLLYSLWKAQQDPNNKTVCRDPRLKTLIVVHSAPDHFEHRRDLREFLHRPPETQVLFALGNSKDEDVQKRVEKESEISGDIARFDFLDTYNNLTYKLQYYMHLIQDECVGSNLKYIVKIDDDVYVNFPVLNSYLNEKMNKYPDRIHCYLFPKNGVIRNRNSKWFVSKEEYPARFYPPYAAGAAQIIPFHLLGPLVEAIYEVPFLWVDDAYLGTLALFKRIQYLDVPQYYQFDPISEVNLTSDWKLNMKMVFLKTKFIFAHMNSPKLKKVRRLFFEHMDDVAANTTRFDDFR